MIGTSIWGQLAYRIAPKVSIATEFENMLYKQPGFYVDAPADYKKINVYDNNVPLLFKYHVLKYKKE